MPKRKRSAETGLLAAIEKHQDEIFRALKSAKGFERQRQSKRLRQDGVQADKRQRIEREIAVLKSLDLHQTARAHLASSLLRVESIATSPDFPKELQGGVPKPELPEHERSALHNVTSALYNKVPVRQATDGAIAAVCHALNVSVPDKTKRARKNKRTEKEEQPSDRMPLQPAPINLATAGGEIASDQESVEAEVTEETEFSKLDHLLGSSSDEEDDKLDEERLERFKSREVVNLDDISLSGSSSEADTGEDSDSQSESASPPPAKQRKGEVKQSVTTAGTGVIGGSTFLPSLMGGYISGSESASDIEEARPRKRRGQRGRQAIWEKKYGASAKHLQKESQTGGRDAGWDMRRGAVDGDGRERKTPWKKGVSDPLARSAWNEASGKPTPKPTKRDDQGPLHPSWAAKKKAQDAQKNMSFSGQKIVFE
ncbi:BUD22 domain-containing protein [Hirsutella rhossiliensis]|uniref:BUD22 domain-containing protein n=1 Tax=Hirsutella rhossiliensis TaxID=111463 RepID=A0A9P8MUQ8_9HYPO|nr:BUD22 domain-containing protein [Hirsutella rhossiliensis]KAH0961575.1 BUD22 domain-containing protein [Hirsutella rhossiliensis]